MLYKDVFQNSKYKSFEQVEDFTTSTCLQACMWLQSFPDQVIDIAPKFNISVLGDFFG